MSIHVACAIPNFYRAEHDLGKQQGDTLIKHGYKVVNGTCQNFDAPGLGIELNPKRLGNLKTQFDVKQ